jgi:hypothetical protein
VGITKAGAILAAEDIRNREIRRPIDLQEASARVAAKRGRAPVSVEYEYFHNLAETGVSTLRPLAVVRTEKGALYFNSRGEVFAEFATPIAAEFRGRGAARPMRGERTLQQLEGWDTGR